MCSHQEWQSLRRRFEEAVEDGELREFVADAVIRVEAFVEELKSRGCAPEDVVCGMEVEVGFVPGPGGFAIPSFVAKDGRA